MSCWAQATGSSASPFSSSPDLGVQGWTGPQIWACHGVCGPAADLRTHFLPSISPETSQVFTESLTVDSDLYCNIDDCLVNTLMEVCSMPGPFHGPAGHREPGEYKTDRNPSLEGLNEKVTSEQRPEGAEGGLGQEATGGSTFRQNSIHQNYEVRTTRKARWGRLRACQGHAARWGGGTGPEPRLRPCFLPRLERPVGAGRGVPVCCSCWAAVR